VVLGGLVGDVLGRTRALAAIYRQLAGAARPVAIRPVLGELGEAKAAQAAALEPVARGLGAPPAPGPPADGPPLAPVLAGLRGEGLAAALQAEQGLQAVFQEAAAVGEGLPEAAGLAEAAAEAAAHRRRLLALYQRFS
jgi:hypothetical protein